MFKGCVLYTDGGSNGSNPGPIGYGGHGYVYEFSKPRRGIGVSGIAATNKGYLDKKKNTIDKIEEDTVYDSETTYEVDVVTYINFYGSYLETSTNNHAELLGMIYALEYIKDKDFQEVRIFSDSKYVVDGLLSHSKKWVKNDYKKSDGQEISNKDVFARLIELYDSLEKKPIIEWVKGHDGHLGNELADMAATIGAQKSYQNMSFTNAAKAFTTDEHVEFSEVDEFFRYDASIHPLLQANRFYFNPGSSLGDNEYYLAELGDKVEDIHFGKEISDAALIISRLNQKDEVLSVVEKAQDEWLKKTKYGRDVLVAGYLNNISVNKFYNQLLTFKDSIIKMPERQRPDLFSMIDGKPLTEILNPPHLAMRCLKQYTDMDTRLNTYLDKSFIGMTIDITDYIYKRTFKDDGTVKKIRLEPSITPRTKYIEKKVIISNNGKDVERFVTLTFGIDLPKIQTLKRLEQYHPKIDLLVWPMDDVCYRYCVVITLENGEVSMWMATYSNNFFI